MAKLEACREWLDDKCNYCYAPAPYIVWGNLFEPEQLGPRCHDHLPAYYRDRGKRGLEGVAIYQIPTDDEEKERLSDKPSVSDVICARNLMLSFLHFNKDVDVKQFNTEMERHMSQRCRTEAASLLLANETISVKNRKVWLNETS